jgi:hypothetical protein
MTPSEIRSERSGMPDRILRRDDLIDDGGGGSVYHRIFRAFGIMMGRRSVLENAHNLPFADDPQIEQGNEQRFADRKRRQSEGRMIFRKLRHRWHLQGRLFNHCCWA